VSDCNRMGQCIKDGWVASQWGPISFLVREEYICFIIRIRGSRVFSFMERYQISKYVVHRNEKKMITYDVRREKMKTHEAANNRICLSTLGRLVAFL
jgi:hypothetical protein